MRGERDMKEWDKSPEEEGSQVGIDSLLNKAFKIMIMKNKWIQEH